VLVSVALSLPRGPDPWVGTRAPTFLRSRKIGCLLRFASVSPFVNSDISVG